MNFGKVALLALASASMVFMASCKDDKVKKAAPTVEVKTAGGEVLKGAAKETDFALVVEAKPAKDLKVTEINYMVTYGTSSSKPAKLSLEKSKTLEAWLGKIERTAIPAEVKEGKIKITAIDSDKNQTIKEIDFNFSGTTPTPNPGETGWNAEKQGAINHATGGKNGAFNLKTGEKVMLASGKPEDRYMMNTSKQGADFVAGWSSKEVNGLKTNPKGNNTAFVKASVDYDKVTVADADAAFKAGTASTDVAAVAVGDVYLAQKGAEFYIIKITKVDNDNNSTRKGEKGCIEFSYKAKK